MKLYVPGSESKERVAVLLKMTKISSVSVIAALYDHLTKGSTEELAAYMYDVDLSNLKRALKRINQMIDYHNQLTELR
jgi:hypothetical protein